MNHLNNQTFSIDLIDYPEKYGDLIKSCVSF
jgi:hypothetical protein